MNVRTRTLNALAAAAVTTVCASAGIADEALPPELIACTNERDVIRRLSCFDSAMAALLAESIDEPSAAAASEPASSPVPRSPATAMATAAPKRAAEPGSEPAPTPGTDPAPAPAPVPERKPPAAAVATVTEMSHERESRAASPSAQSPQAESVNVPAAEPPAVASALSVRRENSVYEPEEFTATVTSIRKRPYGELIILLSNGQIWEQKHLDRRFRLAVGDEVTVSKGKVSGYRLRGRGNNSIQVERLQ